jgi:tetratricopeptide (TPR) repeat protein
MVLLFLGCSTTAQTRRQAGLEKEMDRIAELRCEGLYDQALKLSLETESKYGPDALLFVTRSALLESLGRIDEAAAEGSRSISLWADGYLYMARFYDRQGDKASADTMIKVALDDSRVQHDAKLRAEVHLLKATRYLAAGEKEGALQECDIALVLAPENESMLRERIRSLKERARKE